MKRAFLMVVCLAAAACMKPVEKASTTGPDSGLDPSAFDKSIRPQDDLFQHVNGPWLKATAIPADKASYGAFDILVDKSQADLRTIIEEAAGSATKTPGSDAQKIGDVYDSFMNEARADQLGLTPLKSELD